MKIKSIFSLWMVSLMVPLVWGTEKNTLFLTDQFRYESRIEAINSSSSSVSLLLGTGSYTLAAWVKVNLDSTSLGHRYLPIMGQCRNDGGIFRLYYDMTLGQFVFGRDTKAALREELYLHAPVADAGAWNFVTAVYDQEGQEIRLYVNGVLCDSKAATDSISLSNNNIFRVGFAYYGNVNRYFRGNLAEMSVWDKPLDAEKIQSIMLARPAGEELEECFAYWPMSAGGKTRVIDDISGHGRVLKMDESNNAVTGTRVEDFPEFEATSRNVLYVSRRSVDKQVRPSGNLKVITTDGSFTVSGWVKLNATVQNILAYAPIFSQDPVTDQNSHKAKIRLYYEKATQSYVFERFSQTGNAAESNPVKAECTTPCEWTYVTAVYDKENSTRSIYLNGVLAATMEDTEVITPSCPWFRFGFSFINSTNYTLRGYLAEWSVWDSALSAAKIQSIMSARPEDEELEGCLGYWTFDEDYLTICTDISPRRSLNLTNADPTIVVPSTECADFPAFSTGKGIAYSVTVVVPTDGSVTVTENTESPREDGKYYSGTTASYTAESDTRTFVRWFGDVPEGMVSNATISITVEKDSFIAPYFENEGWVFTDSGKKKITDGYWVLDVREGEYGLVIRGAASNPCKVGILDLSKPVDGGSVSIGEIATLSFSGNKVLTDVMLPDTLRVIGGPNDGWGSGAFYQCDNLRSVTPFLPDSVDYFGGNLFEKCYALTGDLVLNRKGGSFTIYPKPACDNECIFRDTSITSVDVGEGLTELPPRTFSNSSQMTNAVLRGVTVMGRYIFSNCAKLDDLWLYEKPTWDMTGDSFPTNNGKHRWHVLARNEAWQDFLADPANVTRWSDLDAAAQAVYRTHYPTGRVPYGRLTAATKTGEPWVLTFMPDDEATVIFVR